MQLLGGDPQLPGRSQCQQKITGVVAALSGLVSVNP